MPLSITRRRSEAFLVGDNVRVSVQYLGRDFARFNIDLNGPDGGFEPFAVTRGPGESFQPTPGVTVTVRKVCNREARLSIDAPRRVPIWREEVWHEIRARESEQADTTQGEV